MSSLHPFHVTRLVYTNKTNLHMSYGEAHSYGGKVIAGLVHWAVQDHTQRQLAPSHRACFLW